MATDNFELAWPVELFRWEAGRLVDEEPFNPYRLQLLFQEGLVEADAVNALDRLVPVSQNIFDDTPAPPEANEAVRRWVRNLLDSPDALTPYEPPRYFSQRQGSVAPSSLIATTFVQDFLELIEEFSEVGYFPRVLPPYCPDEDQPSDAEMEKRLRRALRLNIPWPLTERVAAGLTEPVLFSLVEYFHDQAQRPRTYTIHGYGDCVRHYHDYDADAGGAVYRWKVNELLASHQMQWKLASSGPEKGQLVRAFPEALDDVLQSQLAQRQDASDEVAHAIRDYRQRDAGLIEKRNAISLLAGELERRRRQVKDLLSKRDESDLFDIANNFFIRHKGDAQKQDYGLEFADWMFLNQLAAIELLDAIERRNAAAEEEDLLAWVE